MAYDWQNRAAARPATWADVDTGLRQYMLRVYNYMGAALVLTGLVAYGAAASGLYLSIARTPLIWLVVFAPLGLVFLLSFGIQRMSLGVAQLTFWSYAALVGLSLGFIFLAYTGASIVSTFMITAAPGSGEPWLITFMHMLVSPLVSWMGVVHPAAARTPASSAPRMQRIRLMWIARTKH